MKIDADEVVCISQYAYLLKHVIVSTQDKPDRLTNIPLGVTRQISNMKDCDVECKKNNRNEPTHGHGCLLLLLLQGLPLTNYNKSKNLHQVHM